MDGQFTLYDINKKKRPCEYSFQRFIGQKVRVRGKVGIIVEIEPYYTTVLQENSDSLICGTPYDLTPLE